MSLPFTRDIVEAWRDDYNSVGSHSAPSNQTLEELAGQMTKKTAVGF
jgi:hypothetical protein